MLLTLNQDPFLLMYFVILNSLWESKVWLSSRTANQLQKEHDSFQSEENLKLCFFKWDVQFRDTTTRGSNKFAIKLSPTIS